MKTNIFGFLSAAGMVLLLAGCASAPKPLYYHGDYPDQVYESLKNDHVSVGKQIKKMEEYFQTAQRKQLPAAPGAHAHLGMMLVHAGQNQAAFNEFETEKRLFPESAVFMDFLMKKSSSQPVNQSIHQPVKKEAQK